jgi:hypothetical protein
MADENLRIDSRFNLIGAFWLPETPDTVMTGTLVSDEHNIEFVAAPLYRRQPNIGLGMFDAPNNKMIPALHGFAETGHLTLCQVFEHRGPNLTNFSLGQSINSRAFRVLTCIEGMHIDGIDDKCLDSAKFSFAGLSAWLPSAFTETWEPERIVVTIPSEPREILDVSVYQRKLRVTVKVVPGFTSGETDLSRISRSVVSIEVRYPHPESLDTYRTVAGLLENLFSLLTGGSVGLDTLFIYRDDQSGHMITKRPGPRSHFDQMQCVVCAPSELAKTISIWLSLPSEFEAVETLALEVLRKSKLFVQTEFLALAQALEGFHRATEPQKNGPVLAARLAALCNRFSPGTLAGMKIDQTFFTSNVVVTRNFLTHAGGSEKPNKKPVKGKDLFLLNQKMRNVLRGVILLYLCIPEAKIADVLARQANKWE